MKKVTKILVALALSALTIVAAGCGGDTKEAKKADPNAPVKIGVTAGPHAEIMDNVKKLAAKEGLQVEVVEFSDYVSPNVALAQNELLLIPCSMLLIWQQPCKRSLNLSW